MPIFIHTLTTQAVTQREQAQRAQQEHAATGKLERVCVAPVQNVVGCRAVHPLLKMLSVCMSVW